MTNEARCKSCNKPVAWGQRNDAGQPLDDKTRLKLCWTCSKAKRDKAKVVPLRVTA